MMWRANGEAISLDRVSHLYFTWVAVDYLATDFYYLTGFNEPDATLVLGGSSRT